MWKPYSPVCDDISATNPSVELLLTIRSPHILFRRQNIVSDLGRKIPVIQSRHNSNPQLHRACTQPSPTMSNTLIRL